MSVAHVVVGRRRGLAPAAPVIVIPSAGDVGLPLNVSGTASGSGVVTVTLYVDSTVSGLIGSTVVVAGAWSFPDIPILQGAHTLIAVASNAGGSSPQATRSVNVVGIAAIGTRRAKAVGLAAILASREWFPYTSGANPDPVLGYWPDEALYNGWPNPWCWAIEATHAMDSYPGYFDGPAMKRWADWYFSRKGLSFDPTHYPGNVFPPNALHRDLTLDASDFVPATFHAHPVYWAYKRGQTSVYPRLAEAEAALDGWLRDATTGLVKSDVVAPNGWNYEDAVDTSHNLIGPLGMASGFVALGYHRLWEVATAQGNSADVARLLGKRDAMVANINTHLRRGDGFYNAGTGYASSRHIALTSLLTWLGVLSSADADASAAALVTQYDLGNVAQFGGTRHLVAPDTYNGSTGYQGLAYWNNWWTGWTAMALRRASSAKGDALAQASVHEFLREMRQDARAPYEYLTAAGTPSTARRYIATAGQLSVMVEAEPAYYDLVLNAGNGWNIRLNMPNGHAIRRVQVTSPTTQNVTVRVVAAHTVTTSALDDTTDGPESTLVDVALAGIVADM